MRKMISADQIEKAKRLRADGKTWPEIAKLIDAGSANGVKKAVDRGYGGKKDPIAATGKKTRKKREHVTQDIIERAKELRAEGMSWRDAAKEVGRDASTIQKAVTRGIAHKGGKGSKALLAAKSALRRMNHTGPKVPLALIYQNGKGVHIEHVKGTAKATARLVALRLEGREPTLYREVPYTLTAQLEGRID